MMRRSRTFSRAILMLILPFLAGLVYLISGGAKVVVRPRLPYESWTMDEEYSFLSKGHRCWDMLGHPIPVGARPVSPQGSGPEQRLFLRVSRSVSVVELLEDLWIMSRIAQEDKCKTTIIFSYE